MNKKKSRQSTGVSSFAQQEFHGIFVADGESPWVRKPGSAKHDDSCELREKRLVDEVEPCVLSKKYVTRKDCLIRGIDILERIQVMQ